MQTLVGIVIPIYKESLSELEQKSLLQCKKVLGNYPIHFVLPEGLKATYIEEHFPTAQRNYFPAQFFTSTQSYNHLLIDPTFYEQFTSHEFILIYQLDAYVFRDELKEWCQKGYDYIGAPKLKKKHWENENTIQWPVLDPIMMNGGLSLRKVAPIIRFLNWYHRLFGTWPANEDSLFSVYHKRAFPLRFLLKLPSWKEALAFAFEQNPKISLQINGGKLPFGCHAWERYNPSFWKPYMDNKEN
ncbi:DUF5672 family protein [Aquirufa rosea]|uniref:DUF5672 domain-containing protein n=1 Tax=Aquirufa rosea TaxID=2509241 RepID=A0A4Q1BX88_9BACT|nr:DUF5672 family protein [Aquirufa rosea]RXK46814.1 hypothetical protein ESB04_11660 [Aquirufa rosea]